MTRVLPIDRNRKYKNQGPAHMTHNLLKKVLDLDWLVVRPFNINRTCCPCHPNLSRKRSWPCTATTVPTRTKHSGVFCITQLLDSPVFQSLIFMHMLLWTDHSCF